MQGLMQTYCNYLFYLTSYNSFTPSPHLTLLFQNVPFYQNKLNHIFTSKRFNVLINISSNTQTVIVSGVQCGLAATGAGVGVRATGGQAEGPPHPLPAGRQSGQDHRHGRHRGREPAQVHRGVRGGCSQGGRRGG